MTNAGNIKVGSVYICDKGINGSGHRVYQVISEWTGVDGRRRYHAERFDTLAEAENWLRFA